MLPLLLVSIWFALCGCSSIAPMPQGSDNAEARLTNHVQYLSKPELKGRKTGTSGARLARRYIERQFQACSLVPWPGEKGYELPFRFGKNVVGILPGSDPQLSGEMVLVTAHYDHIGKDSKGRICRGAVDNASGVAVLLEAARQLSQGAPRLKRTIGFVAFDAEEEMLLGSFAFCCRADVEQAKIAGVVNVDMVGRDFMEVVTNTLIITGTEGHPELRKEVLGFGGQAGIRVLPLGSDLVGPLSDHVAFETRDMPCLFFSCGTFGDYHKWSDTPEKINSVELGRSAKVIIATVAALANQERKRELVASDCDREELESVEVILSEICRSPDKAGIRKQDIKGLEELRSTVEKVAKDGNYNRVTRELLLIQASTNLFPYILGTDEIRSKPALMAVLPLLEHLYINYHREMLEGHKQLMAAVLRHPPGLFRGLRTFKYEIYNIQDEDIIETPGNTNKLHALVNTATWSMSSKTSFWPLKSSSVSIGTAFEPLDCEGSQEQLRSYALLRLRRNQTNQLHLKAIKKVLRAIDGAEPAGDYHDWLQARLTNGGHKDEIAWLLSCLQSGNPNLAHEALGAARGSQDSRILKATRELLSDRSVRSDVRARAMENAVQHGEKATLLALVEVLDDSSPVYQRAYCPQLQADYPLAKSMSFQAFRPLLETQITQKAKTIGQTALENLRKKTKKNFGTDKEKWKRWIERYR